MLGQLFVALVANKDLLCSKFLWPLVARVGHPWTSHAMLRICYDMVGYANLCFDLLFHAMLGFEMLCNRRTYNANKCT